jgi:hypothetical protein
LPPPPPDDPEPELLLEEELLLLLGCELELPELLLLPLKIFRRKLPELELLLFLLLLL